MDHLPFTVDPTSKTAKNFDGQIVITVQGPIETIALPATIFNHTKQVAYSAHEAVWALATLGRSLGSEARGYFEREAEKYLQEYDQDTAEMIRCGRLQITELINSSGGSDRMIDRMENISHVVEEHKGRLLAFALEEASSTAAELFGAAAAKNRYCMERTQFHWHVSRPDPRQKHPEEDKALLGEWLREKNAEEMQQMKTFFQQSVQGPQKEKVLQTIFSSLDRTGAFEATGEKLQQWRMVNSATEDSGDLMKIFRKESGVTVQPKQLNDPINAIFVLAEVERVMRTPHSVTLVDEQLHVHTENNVMKLTKEESRRILTEAIKFATLFQNLAQ